MPEFEWNEAKRQAAQAKHSLSLRVMVEVFEGAHVVLQARSDIEPRQMAAGVSKRRIVALVVTERDGRIGLITARRARENEQPAHRTRHG